MWLLLIVFVVSGDIDFSYRIQPNQEICEIRKDKVFNYLTQYGRNVEHIEATCLYLEDNKDEKSKIHD